MTVVSKCAESFHKKRLGETLSSVRRLEAGRWNVHGHQGTRQANTGRLFVQDHTEEGTVDVKPAIVTNEAQFPELIHEEIDPGARCANHLRQHLL
jgi:hypothetical protein